MQAGQRAVDPEAIGPGGGAAREARREARSVALEENEAKAHLSDLDLVALGEGRGPDPLAVQLRAVRRRQVLDYVATGFFLEEDERLLATDAFVQEGGCRWSGWVR